MITSISVEIDHIPKPADDVDEVITKPFACPLGPAAGEVTVFAANPDEQGRQFKSLFSFRRSASGVRAIALLRDQSAVVRLDDAEFQLHGVAGSLACCAQQPMAQKPDEHEPAAGSDFH